MQIRQGLWGRELCSCDPLSQTVSGGDHSVWPELTFNDEFTPVADPDNGLLNATCSFGLLFNAHHLRRCLLAPAAVQSTAQIDEDRQRWTPGSSNHARTARSVLDSDSEYRLFLEKPASHSPFVVHSENRQWSRSSK